MCFGKFVVTKVYGAWCPVYLFFVFLLMAFLVSSARIAVAEDAAYREELVERAHAMCLFGDRYWDVLLHYKRSGSGKKGLITDPKFYLSPVGRRDPGAELDATIRSFFVEENKTEEPPRCRFIARYTWLKDKLHIDEARLPATTCAKFNDALASVNPKSAVFIFPAAHLNSPASMFGHTLIRINSDLRSDLLSHAVSYAAVTDDSNGFLYAFKGLFGLYKGYYSVLPYYEKVKEYNDMERRDIWEYPLNLSEEETRRMFLHIWELKDIYSDYYFFDENCSYELLFLLEAARPSVDMTGPLRDRLRFWVIPPDTIRVVRESGLIEKVKYRPSQATRVEMIASLMGKDDQKTTLNVVRKAVPPQEVLDMNISTERKARILDLATELLQYKYARKELQKDDYLKQFLTVLNARSTLGTQPNDLRSLPTPSQPEEGHRSGRMVLGAGYATTGKSLFTELGWRAAFHDLLDPDAGYIEGGQIDFFSVRGRYYSQDNTFRLQSFRFVDIVSLSPRDLFFKPISWKVNTGFDRELCRDGQEHLIYRVNPGGGFAYQNRILGLYYGMVETDLNVSRGLKNDFALGFGVSAGIIKKVTESWKMHIAAQSMYYEAGDVHQSMKASLIQNFRISTNNSVRLSLWREKTFHQYQTEALLGWNYYY
jgi:hypothetical protein